MTQRSTTITPTEDVSPSATAPAGTAPPRYANRELSWLDFADRLLDLASDEREPLLERTRFLAICAEGLDEFFQVRVAALEDQVAAGIHTRSPDGMRPGEQLEAVSNRVAQITARGEHIFLESVAPSLAGAGIILTPWGDLDSGDRRHLADVFDETMFPVLTPLAVDQRHPFPYISNLSLNLLVRLYDPDSGRHRIARVKIPASLPRLVPLPDGHRWVLVEHVVSACLDRLFPGVQVVEHHVFRVTRNADLSVDEEDAHDLLAAVELELHRRRFGQAVRLEVEATTPEELVSLLVSEIDVPGAHVHRTHGLVNVAGLRALDVLVRPDLSVEPWAPIPPPRLAEGGRIFDVLASGDVLVHHPYESFTHSVEAFVREAADDPGVLAIKQTLYRTGEDSPIVAALMRAAHAGKQVTVVVELQARFDERTNIAWARALEEAGAHVIYGLTRLKTHSKISLVMRQEGSEVRRYCHIGSGNYNSVTARSYEDVGLLTADPAVGSDVAELLSLLAGSEQPVHFRRLVVSPVALRAQILSAIADEAAAGSQGRIVIKTNGLTDPEVIDALYRASTAGVQIDLVVRGRCCLVPGVPGLSENIRVRSIVGRFLEHSRIFRFGGVAQRPLRVSFGSPDLMERNLDRRVEVVVPVDDETIRDRLVTILDDALADVVNAWELGADGSWTWCRPATGALDDAPSLQGRSRSRAQHHWEETLAVPSRPGGAINATPVSSTGTPPAVNEPPRPWWKRWRTRFRR